MGDERSRGRCSVILALGLAALSCRDSHSAGDACQAQCLCFSGPSDIGPCVESCSKKLTSLEDGCSDCIVQAGCGGITLPGTPVPACSQACAGSSICGDAKIDPGEVCDDGSGLFIGPCSNDCQKLYACGDGVRDETEVCDDGNTTSADGCRGDCGKMQVCGDGFVDFGEACDGQEGCQDCRLGTCGDGVSEPGELCYGPAVDLSSPLGAIDVAIADMDGDGQLDLVHSSDDIYVRLNAGGGTLAAPIPAHTGAGPFRVADMDRDGDVDLVAELGNGVISVLLNDGQGNLSPAGNASGSGPMAVSDLDEDLLPDLVAVSQQGVSVFLNAGSGQLQLSGTYPIGDIGFALPSLALGDLDGDGDADVLIGEPLSGGIGVTDPLLMLPNDGSGHLGDALQSLVSFPVYLAVADVDGDGDLDALMSYTELSVALNDGTGSFGTPVGFASGPGLQQFAVADLDGDGYPDIAGALVVLRGDGAGHFSSTPIPGEDSFGPLAVGDLTGDGVPEIVVGSDTHGSVRIIYPVP